MKLIMKFAMLMTALLLVAAQAPEKYDVLAVHKTKATFKGTREQADSVTVCFRAR